ncbi:MAG: fused MFS/spermidine synthase [Gemmatimonadaceae bacterium]|nr:fused MFS/spermidine synthase [Gemmatimonadaceae bacterium]
MPVAANALVALFAVATFLNAALLFVVEPMFTKLVLPLLGGTPAVWNTCLLFFQAALLVGYLYTYLTTRWLSVPRQAVLHVALLALAASTLPITIGAVRPPTSGTGAAIWWLLSLLATTLGAPFVLLAAGAPMLQRWFAGTRHRLAGNPYFLYVASNLGSFAALLAYPTLIEPSLRLGEQGVQWAWGYGVLLALLATAGIAAWRAGESSRSPADAPANANESTDAPLGSETAPTGRLVATRVPTLVPTRAWRLRWVLLSFAPSSLLLGVTTYLSTDIASVPFLWVVPLALYLLTFVLVFARRPLLNRRHVLFLQVFLALGLMLSIGANPASHLAAVATLHLVTFFVMALACHRELADARPRAEFLTEYYLWISLGGLLGGVFNVLLAPILYDSVIEYPFAMIVALALRPMWNTVGSPRRAAIFDVVGPLLILGVVVLGSDLPLPSGKWGDYTLYAFLGATALAAATFYKRPLRLALGAAALYLGTDLGLRAESDTIYQGRSFYGVYRVRQYSQFLVLQHGTTTHGGQARLASRKKEPLTYYHREGPLGDIFRLATDSTRARDVALVGLGTGTTACYARAGERWTYYEIDPLVVSLATHPQLFTYLRLCQPDVRIVLGDARLSLAAAPDSSLDLIVLDAFSSDAIPVHLMTREALQLYTRKLRQGGVVAFHISNRYLELEPVLVELARDARLAGASGNRDVTEKEKSQLIYASRWVAMAASAHTLAPLVRDAGWSVLAPSASSRVWTDDYSDVWHALKK